MSREIPILFSSSMVNAILRDDNPKKQTRRKPSFRAEVGDILWVRETWATHIAYDDDKPSALPVGTAVWYLADGPKPGWAGKTRVSIFMPRWASRISLEVVAVREEPLQCISEMDAIAEGVCAGFVSVRAGYKWMTAREAYAVLWDHINGKTPGFAWADNPTVKVVTFKRIK